MRLSSTRRLHDLLQSPGGTVSSEQVGWYGGIIFSVLLIGWAIGGICFGVISPLCRNTGGTWRSTAFSRPWVSGGMGGRSCIRRGNLAGRETGEGGRHTAIGLGFRVLHGCIVQFIVERLWVAGDACDRRTPGLCIVAGSLVCEGAGPVDQGPRYQISRAPMPQPYRPLSATQSWPAPASMPGVCWFLPRHFSPVG